MKKFVCGLLAVSAMGLAGCEREPEFSVFGLVDGASDKMLYLEASGIEGVVALDSTRLSALGDYKFSAPKPESPEFYRLRIDNKVVNFSVDSTETIEINSSYASFSTGYEVKGSDNSAKMKELTLLQYRLKERVNRLAKATREGQIGAAVAEDSLQRMVEQYKDTVKMNYVFAAPNKPYAYYALFQEMDGLLLFNPYENREDLKCFAAVATSMNNSYPHADRSKNLYNMVIKGMKNTRPVQPALAENNVNMEEAGLIDIALPDLKGNERKLSDLKGKVVLLDFTAYQAPVSVSHNFMLRELYDKYASRGLEIYQVSLDPDEHFWRTSADNLPWVCVYDCNGAYSVFAGIYNVQKLPTYFLISRDNEVSARDEQVKNLEDEIRKLL